MKAMLHILRLCIIIFPLLIITHTSVGQGRVVVNEFMSWSGCNTTNEYIELLNFGPGPMDISCYIVTNGTYSVTIPQNTILTVGEYYVLSGVDVLQKDCGNTDSTIRVNLNWNSCNCTNKPIPTTGNGFLQNGGNANEKIILLDHRLNVLDAVSRNSNPSSSVEITTSSNNGSCPVRTFNLGLMNIRYEAINNSTGINNSFARKVDGDCGWVKTTAISAGAPNKTGSTSSANYSFTTLSASQCNGNTGSISILVSATNITELFPMTYTLAYDSNGNNIFEESDHYQYGTDSSAPSIDIDNLAYGRYRITVGSSTGCNLQSFDFFIFNCYGVILPYKVNYFQYIETKDGNDHFDFRLTGIENIEKVILEGGNGNSFRALSTLQDLSENENALIRISLPQTPNQYFRLRFIDRNTISSYSEAIRVLREKQLNPASIWPNPVKDIVYVNVHSEKTEKCRYVIYNSFGQIIHKATIPLTNGLNTISIHAGNLVKGLYYIKFEGQTTNNNPGYRFIKL